MKRIVSPYLRLRYQRALLARILYNWRSPKDVARALFYMVLGDLELIASALLRCMSRVLLRISGTLDRVIHAIERIA
jgi:hypothetical protein